MESFPIPKPTDEQREGCEQAANRLIAITKNRQRATRDLLDWLKVEHGIDAPSTTLANPVACDSDSFIAEVRKARGKKNPLNVFSLRSLREEFARSILPAQALASEARSLEVSISDLVNEAYGLTPAEIQTMWESAPPRMPIARPR